MEIVYRAKGKEIGLVFLFKYDLNGHLKQFEIVEGELNGKQMKWLFSENNFPANESIMKAIWMKDKKYIQVFDIEKSVPDTSFEVFWNLYDHKVKRVLAEKIYEKLNEADKMKAISSIKPYNNYLQRRPGIQKAHPSTYLNQRYYEDEWNKAI